MISGKSNFFFLKSAEYEKYEKNKFMAWIFIWNSLSSRFQEFLAISSNYHFLYNFKCHIEKSLHVKIKLYNQNTKNSD